MIRRLFAQKHLYELQQKEDLKIANSIEYEIRIYKRLVNKLRDSKELTKLRDSCAPIAAIMNKQLDLAYIAAIFDKQLDDTLTLTSCLKNVSNDIRQQTARQNARIRLLDIAQNPVHISSFIVAPNLMKYSSDESRLTGLKSLRQVAFQMRGKFSWPIQILWKYAALPCNHVLHEYLGFQSLIPILKKTISAAIEASSCH
jgi:hypothetical protein